VNTSFLTEKLPYSQIYGTKVRTSYKKRRQSLSRSSSCSSQPTPPGGIYDGPTNISTEQLKPELLVNPGYVDPAGNIKIYQTQGYSPESFRRANMVNIVVKNWAKF